MVDWPVVARVCVFVIVVVTLTAVVATALARRQRNLPPATPFGRAAPEGSATPFGRAPEGSADQPRTQPRQRVGAPCGAVFDIDGTITCGNPSRTLKMCIDKGCAIGINTARRKPYAGDVNLEAMGFPPNVLSGEDFFYNPHASVWNVTSTKVEGLREFQRKHGIADPGSILFFDDDPGNVAGAAAAGFSAIPCSVEGVCGIGAAQEAAAQDILQRV